MHRKEGYVLIILLIAIFVMSIGLLVAIPVWETQIQREKEKELIFRGKQYVEAIRLFQTKHPGSFPKSFDELVEEKCIRKLFPDPMTKDGEWNIILPYSGSSSRRRGATTQTNKILVVPQSALSSVQNPQIIGVVSSSTKSSFKIYLEQETYDQWLFFYGQDPQSMPEIVYYGEDKRD
ncbi:MAG: type II secretion system protein [Candidatus Aminicenantes bacterium]|nr:MAG: type II secretion system protein [Candidatus Aminicenantes bacterium]